MCDFQESYFRETFYLPIFSQCKFVPHTLVVIAYLFVRIHYLHINLRLHIAYNVLNYVIFLDIFLLIMQLYPQFTPNKKKRVRSRERRDTRFANFISRNIRYKHSIKINSIQFNY